MPFMVATMNTMLDAFGITHVSLHSGFPGTSGANELSGGPYARQAISWNAANLGSKKPSNQPVFTVPGGETVQYIGLWDALTLGTFLGYVLPGGAVGRKYRVVLATDLIDLPGHGYVADQAIAFFNGTPPVGLSEGVVYYVRSPTADTFEVAAAPGGAKIDLTGAGDADTRVSAITVESFGAEGQYTLLDADLSLLR